MKDVIADGTSKYQHGPVPLNPISTLRWSFTNYLFWKRMLAIQSSKQESELDPIRAQSAMKKFAEKWDKKYHYAIQPWQDNWDCLPAFYDYPMEIRKLIYTTNTIENLSRGIRKYTKTKAQFPDDQLAIKAVYLAIDNIQKKWSMPVQN